MTDSFSEEVCRGCGKPWGSGTLLDQIPVAPELNTSIHRLYVLTARSDFNFDNQAALKEPVDQPTWEEFASRHRCLVCAEYLMEVGDDDS